GQRHRVACGQRGGHPARRARPQGHAPISPRPAEEANREPAATSAEAKEARVAPSPELAGDDAPAAEDVSGSQQITYRVRPGGTAPSAGRRASGPALALEAPVSQATLCDEKCEADAGGILTPALVVGLGQHGLNGLRRLGQELQGRFGATDAAAALRLLYIDTDPEATREAVRGSPGVALDPMEVVLARLNRPSHYLKTRDTRDGRAQFE